MAKTFTKIGKQIAIAVKAGGPEPDMNPEAREHAEGQYRTCHQERYG